MRLDAYLVDILKVRSRTYAKELIIHNLVLVNNLVCSKPSFVIKSDDEVKILNELYPYVSRSALKLKQAIENFSVDIKDKTVMDVGSSTGGFCNYCLSLNCKKIYAIDVGTDQLNEKIRSNPKVIIKEKTDFRTINKGVFTEEIDVITVDVSFISLRLVLPKIKEIAGNQCAIICLVKPQFEVGAANLNKLGIARNKNTIKKALNAIYYDIITLPLKVLAIEKSILLGKTGNQEYLLYLSNDFNKISISRESYLSKI